MIDIAAIFKNKKLDAEKLSAYGFIFSDDRFTKNFPIMQEQYIAKITISAAGDADVMVYDAENREEYVLAHVLNATGAFVGEVHKECEAILRDISRKCFFVERFKCDQTKRIVRRIKETYGAEPEFLWGKSPEFAVFRVPGKKPWFALIGRVSKNKFGLTESGMVDFINLKNEPSAVVEHLNAHLAFPAYHMNKRHWYSVRLDERLSDEEIVSMVNASCESVKSQ